MSKLSTLREAIQKLDEAEAALLQARRAFDFEPEFHILAERANSVSDIRFDVNRLFTRIESEIASAAGLKAPEPAILLPAPRPDNGTWEDDLE